MLDLFNLLAHTRLKFFIVSLKSQVLLTLSYGLVSREFSFTLGLLKLALEFKSVSQDNKRLIGGFNVLKVCGR